MASTLATIGFKEALGSARLPPMTVPFCAVALGAYMSFCGVGERVLPKTRGEGDGNGV